MNKKIVQNKVSNKGSLETVKDVDCCKVSIASVEIMLERFCNGQEIDFPFSQ